MDPARIQEPEEQFLAVEDSAPEISITEGPRELGRGRSGFVYLGLDEAGNRLACKVFDSRSLTKLVQIAFLGSPNPYCWNEDAVRCALLRRRVLADLVEHWFGDRLKVAAGRAFVWNQEHAAFELRTEFSHGSPVPLHHPLRVRGEGLLKELTSEVMRPLQDHLVQSGFDGSVWQAGKGNPVALNNFLYERNGEGGQWVWIDLESGVPALFPANPLSLLYYLPRSFQIGRPLFDDVNAQRLLDYISKNQKALAASLGAERMSRLQEDVVALREHQVLWKSLPLHWRSIGYRLARGQISEKQAAHYRKARWRWVGREITRCAWGGLKSLTKLPGAIARVLGRIDWIGIPRFFARVAVSQRFRGHLARMYVGRRIRAWHKRGQLSPRASRHLRDRLRREESSAYLSDFGMHIAIKPLVKAIEFWVLPMMWGVGLIDSGMLALFMLTGGAAVRTLYTGGRLLQAARAGREKPWVALGVGLFPVVGNFAYPMQIIYSSTEKDVAHFILYDGGARVGCLLPIWGGKDTRTEHFFNRLPDVFASFRRKRAVAAGGDEPAASLRESGATSSDTR